VTSSPSYTEAVQDYLKAIYSLTNSGDFTTTKRVAERLNVAAPSVTNMVQRMAAFRPPLVEYHKHKGVALTTAGRAEALRTIRRHRLIELFLVRILGYGWEEVHAEAERLEHAISSNFEDRLAALLGEPDFDPHGDPIPDRNLDLPVEKLVALMQMEVGSRGVVRRISHAEAGLVRYLEEHGVSMNAEIEVLEQVAWDRTVRIRVAGSPQEHVLGEAAASLVWLEISPHA
jgi:DtxR family Mn-dependent transcriptional regulator